MSIKTYYYRTDVGAEWTELNCHYESEDDVAKDLAEKKWMASSCDPREFQFSIEIKFGISGDIKKCVIKPTIDKAIASILHDGTGYLE